MKVFRVVTERDGVVKKMPGKVDTEIIQSDYRYAAGSIEQVWEAVTGRGFAYEDEEIRAIIEEHPAITVLEIPEV